MINTFTHSYRTVASTQGWIRTAPCGSVAKKQTEKKIQTHCRTHWDELEVYEFPCEQACDPLIKLSPQSLAYMCPRNIGTSTATNIQVVRSTFNRKNNKMRRNVHVDGVDERTQLPTGCVQLVVRRRSPKSLVVGWPLLNNRYWTTQRSLELCALKNQYVEQFWHIKKNLKKYTNNPSIHMHNMFTSLHDVCNEIPCRLLQSLCTQNSHILL